MTYIKRQIFSIILLVITPISNVFAYTDRSLLSYFADNIILHLIISGGYISISIFLVLIIALMLKSLRSLVLSFFMALCAVYLLALIYEVFEGMAWVPPMYGH